jgi:hypothetical protein
MEEPPPLCPSDSLMALLTAMDERGIPGSSGLQDDAHVEFNGLKADAHVQPAHDPVEADAPIHNSVQAEALVHDHVLAAERVDPSYEFSTPKKDQFHCTSVRNLFFRDQSFIFHDQFCVLFVYYELRI